MATRGCHNRCGFCYLSTDWLTEWVEQNRLECATFHILTPYPGTPLFAALEAEGRILTRDWEKYDTAHVVFQPRHMTPADLEQGYGWLYQRLFSHASIWNRRPEDWRAVAPYLGMSYLYKRSNPIWHLLIRLRMVHAVWAPLIEWTRVRHLRFRRRLACQAADIPAPGSTLGDGPGGAWATQVVPPP